MKPESQRIAIHEARGIKIPAWAKERNLMSWWVEEIGGESAEIPNYPNDLNAMHEAENLFENYGALSYHQWWSRYAGMLAVVLHTPFDFMPQFTSTHFAANIHATAAQRAEAFLKTIDKWEDDK